MHPPSQLKCRLRSGTKRYVPSSSEPSNAPHGSSKVACRIARVQAPGISLATHRHESAPQTSSFDALKSWVETSGGFVHPSLQLVDAAPCGCRGIVTTSDIDVQQLRNGPLVLVPEELYMTSQQGRAIIAEMISPDFLQTFDQLPGPVQLALFLAAEQELGVKSFWSPYITCLPEDPPCAWWWNQSQLKQFVSNNELPRDWIPRVQSFRESAFQQLRALSQRFNGLRVPEMAVTWSYAQVLSRCFGNHSNVGLAPFIDLLNHSSLACVPDGVELEGKTYVYITSTSSGEPRPLKAGDEVYISYVRDCDPYKTFLNFGFVPSELMHRETPATKAVFAPLKGIFRMA